MVIKFKDILISYFEKTLNKLLLQWWLKNDLSGGHSAEPAWVLSLSPPLSAPPLLAHSLPLKINKHYFNDLFGSRTSVGKKKTVLEFPCFLIELIDNCETVNSIYV